MAQPMLCDAEDANPAVMLITNLENGDASAWCAEHVPEFARQLADATGVLAAEYERGVNDAIAKQGAALAASQAKGKGRGARKATAAQDTGQSGESTPAPESVEQVAAEEWAATVRGIETDEDGAPV